MLTSSWALSSEGALEPARVQGDAKGPKLEDLPAKAAHGVNGSPSLGMTTASDAAASKAVVDDGPLNSEVAPKVGAMVTAEATSPSPTHEAMSADATSSSSPMIGTFCFNPGERAWRPRRMPPLTSWGSLRLSWATLLSSRLGIFPLMRKWAWLTGRLPKCRACSIVSMGVLTRSTNSFCCGPPCSRSRQPPREQGQW
jgi:hypothetical protein